MLRYVATSIAVVGVGLLILGYIAYRALVFAPAESAVPTPHDDTGTQAIVTIGDTRILVELAESDAEITRGLSGRTTLPDGQGMLFIMPHPARYKFWMPDMHFAIDIIWFDETFSIVDITERVAPESYPTTFEPTVPARYVLEVPSGFVAAHSIVVGQRAIVEGV